MVSICVLRAQPPADGLLIYQEPATSSQDVFEYRTFRQDNALFSTLVTSAGERRRLKSAGVIAVVSYPPLEFDSSFAETAEAAIGKISALQNSYPALRSQLEGVKGKWMRSREVFQQIRATPAPPASRQKVTAPTSLPARARLTSATPDSATITYPEGVRTIPLAQLAPSEVLFLNTTSRTIQLPLGAESAAPLARSTPTRVSENGLTRRIESAGRNAIGFAARALKIEDRTFSVWTFFVVLPALLFLLLLAVIFFARRPRAV